MTLPSRHCPGSRLADYPGLAAAGSTFHVLPVLPPLPVPSGGSSNGSLEEGGEGGGGGAGREAVAGEADLDVTLRVIRKGVSE